MRVIGQAHTVVHQRGVLRVQSSMRVGTRYAQLHLTAIILTDKGSHRTDKKQTAADKVKRVHDILDKDQ